MNSSREDYVQAIYRLSCETQYTTNKDIAKYFNISKASVSEMIKKLIKEEYVIVEKNKISLTEKGESKAEYILSVHRIWEYFLQEELGMQYEDTHIQADLLEHVTSEELFRKLNKYLNYPKQTPGGASIYENED